MRNFLLSCACCLLAACSFAAESETELAAKLPEIFAKSAAHYKALDAAATEKVKSEKGNVKGEKALSPHGWLKGKTGKGEYDMRSIYWWTSGFFPGSLWYLYEATQDNFFKTRATAWTEILAPVSKYTENHDVGFMMYCSYGNARRILKTDKYDALLVETANSLCQRYNEKLGLIRSWGAKDETKNFLVIPDNLMNLELLEFAAGQKKVEKKGGGGQWNFDRIARSHADVTMKNHFRADGGCYHVLNYDQRPAFLGTVQEIRRGQGASCETAWSRGQSWAIYGYTMMYRTTGLVRYLDFAKKLADYAINHPNMPADGIPHWDYGRPGEERDSSAGAIMASALLELSQYVGAEDRFRYRDFAVKQLLSLASDAYFSTGNEVGHWLLKHGVGHKPGNSEVDTPLNYGDYYFLEALLRFRQLKAREKTITAAKGLAALPAKAVLAPDELQVRSRVAATNAMAIAAKALAEPIPDTSDELYGEYWTTGNRTHYEKQFFARLRNLDALAAVVGRARTPAAPSDEKYVSRIEDYLNAICDMKSWVLPAHDWTDGGQGNLKGTCLFVDLFSSEVAAHLACVVQLLGDRLDPQLVRRVKDETERRVFAPLRRELPYRPKLGAAGRTPPPFMAHWWADCNMNWSAVCWDNVVCAVLGLVDNAGDRAFFIDLALKSVPHYLSGFTSDGYCSEGMGYWNYGYGHHLLMGRLLRSVTKGRVDVFTYPIQRAVSAYPRSYTLEEGISPAFADGNGAVVKSFLEIIDGVWPDLPKTLPPSSEFPEGQVWLFRDPSGLSVAFKGGHNDEFHNHNDLGSYYVIADGKFVAGDPGGEEYTRFTFSDRRYESKVLNSYGHPVPVVGGQLQGTGAKFAAKVLEKKVEKVGGGGQRNVVVLDLTAGYDVKVLKKLTRTFVYDRTAKTFTVRDRAEFTEPTAFEDCTVTFGALPNVQVKGNGQGQGKTEVALIGKPVEKIENPNRKTPHRYAWTFEKPVTAADVEFVYSVK